MLRLRLSVVRLRPSRVPLWFGVGPIRKVGGGDSHMTWGAIVHFSRSADACIPLAIAWTGDAEAWHAACKVPVLFMENRLSSIRFDSFYVGSTANEARNILNENTLHMRCCPRGGT